MTINYNVNCDAMRQHKLYLYHDVVTDWSNALAGFLVSTLFGVSPSQSYSNFSTRFPFFFRLSTEVYYFVRSIMTAIYYWMSILIIGCV